MDALEYEGLHAKCKVFTSDIEQMAVQQIYGFLNCPVFEGSQIRIMPDVHFGAGAVIGFTAPVGEWVIPNVVGVDIGCGVQTVNLGNLNVGMPWFQQFDDMLRATVPSGFKSRERAYDRKRVKQLFLDYLAPTNYMGEPLRTFEQMLEALADKIGTDKDKVWRSLGTLGGGNHYAELDQNKDNKDIWLTVHSGSRNFGLRVAEFHQHKAIHRMGKNHGLEWLEGEDAKEYLRDMRVAQRFALLNRLVMLDALTQGLGIRLQDHKIIGSIHNFIGDDDIIRKGAISAKKGEELVIPWNMRDGCILGEGKGNEDWNNSAPHGAGRKMARGRAKRELSMEEFTDTMKNVWTSCVTRKTLDEAPMAYKDSQTVEDCIGDTVEIKARLKPVYNFKAGA